MEQKSKSWWETLRGILTAIAAMITAVTGLVVAVYTLNGPESRPGSSMATTPSNATWNSSETTRRADETRRLSGTSASSVAGRSGFAIGLPEISEYVIGAEGQTARYELQSGKVFPFTAEADVLSIHVLFVNLSEHPNSRMHFESGSFRLVIDGRKVGPKERFNYRVLSKKVREEDVLFLIPKGLKHATLKVGNAADGVDIPLDLDPGT